MKLLLLMMGMVYAQDMNPLATANPNFQPIVETVLEIRHVDSSEYDDVKTREVLIGDYVVTLVVNEEGEVDGGCRGGWCPGDPKPFRGKTKTNPNKYGFAWGGSWQFLPPEK